MLSIRTRIIRILVEIMDSLMWTRISSEIDSKTLPKRHNDGNNKFFITLISIKLIKIYLMREQQKSASLSRMLCLMIDCNV